MGMCGHQEGAEFLYEQIWCRTGRPLEKVNSSRTEVFGITPQLSIGLLSLNPILEELFPKSLLGFHSEWSPGSSLSCLQICPSSRKSTAQAPAAGFANPSLILGESIHPLPKLLSLGDNMQHQDSTSELCMNSLRIFFFYFQHIPIIIF